MPFRIRPSCSAANWTRRAIVQLCELALYAFNVVASYILAGVVVGMGCLATGLTVVELWTPCKLIADVLTDRTFH